jgi:hypothetical protein
VPLRVRVVSVPSKRITSGGTASGGMIDGLSVFAWVTICRRDARRYTGLDGAGFRNGTAWISSF